MDEKVLVFDPKDQDVCRSFEQKGFAPPGTKKYKDQRYAFDRVFNEDARQIDVFENTTKPLLDGLLDGFNATVFAYGVRTSYHSFSHSPIHETNRLPAVVKHTPLAAQKRIPESSI